MNRRLSYAVGDGRVTFTTTGAEARVVPAELRELPVLRGFNDTEVLSTLADRFVQQEFAAGDVIVEADQPADQVFLIAHGKVNKIGLGKYDEPTLLNVLADGDYFGDHAWVESQDTWDFTVKAVTACTVLAVSRQTLDELVGQSEGLRDHVEGFRAGSGHAQNKQGEADIELTSGHEGELELAGTFVDYEITPREYELSVAQT
ncbi:MAG: cyclic nucleotide-binding domain-containing protein, partial [Pseudonocardiaceae bacterium]